MVTFQTPAGAELLGLSYAKDVVVVEIRMADGKHHTLVYDGKSGKLLGELVGGGDDEDLPDTSEKN